MYREDNQVGFNCISDGGQKNNADLYIVCKFGSLHFLFL